MSVHSLRYDNYRPEEERLRETLCTVGNGYFATRGAAPEVLKAGRFHYPGTYVAGCYNRVKSDIEGHEVENESLVNLPNWLVATFRFGRRGKWFDPAGVDVLEFEQKLDTLKGILVRKIRFGDGRGRITRLTQTRLASMESPHIGALETVLVAENWSGRASFLSALDGDVTNSGVKNYRFFNQKHLVPDGRSVSRGGVMNLSMRTNQSDIRVVEAARTIVFRKGRSVRLQRRNRLGKACVAQEFPLGFRKGEAVSVEKTVALYTSKDRSISEPGGAAIDEVTGAPRFRELLGSHERRWAILWDRFRIRILGDVRAASIVHVHIFHLLQTVSPNSIDLDVGIPARGLHGEAYRGHIFWDELFIFPLLNVHIPDLTRSLLMYRYRRLPEARRLAANAGARGALFPWESASDGREATPTLQLNSISKRWVRINTHLQYHVDAAVAYNVWCYYQVTKDVDFLSLYGTEMLLEVSRFFGSIASYNRSKKRYEIRGVMGPDEFHDSYPDARRPGLNNNAYTNLMAVWAMQRALEALDLMPQNRREGLLSRLGVKKGELDLWARISREMFVPFFEEGGKGEIISQFEGYEELEELDWDAYREKYKNIQDLGGILASEGKSANDYKVSKQADVLMLFYLFSSEELQELFSRLGYDFDPESIPRIIEYYSSRTSHGSTLSRVVHSWVFARLNREKSWQIAKQALESDLSDIQGGTTPEGIHLGAMAGTVEIIQRCYTGLVARDDVLWFDPRLPKELKCVLFTIYYRGHTFELRLTPETFEIGSSPGSAPKAKIGVDGKVFEISPGEKKRFNIR